MVGVARFENRPHTAFGQLHRRGAGTLLGHVAPYSADQAITGHGGPADTAIGTITVAVPIIELAHFLAMRHTRERRYAGREIVRVHQIG